MKKFAYLGGFAVSAAFLPIAISSAAQADVAPVAPAPAPMERQTAAVPRTHEPARVATRTILPRYTAFRRFTTGQPRQWQAGWDPFAEEVFGPEMQLRLEPELAREAARSAREESRAAREESRERARRAQDMEVLQALMFYFFMVNPEYGWH